MLVGYMRVSTAERNLALQRDALLSAGIAPERVHEDTCSGTGTHRPGLDRALEVIREGDALVIWKLDRIGRSLKHVVGLVNGLQKRGIGLKVLTGGIDTTSSTGRLVFGIFATLAEFERDLILERTMAGLAAARVRQGGNHGRAGPCHHREGPHTTMPPGSALACSRAARLTPSPKMSPSSVMMSARWMPMRSRMGNASGSPAARARFS